MGEEDQQDPIPDPNTDPKADPNPAPEAPTAAAVPVKEMVRAEPSSEAKPSWFTPKRLLFVFCTINLLNYLDRGAIASNGVNGSRRSCNKSGICTNGSGIQGDFNLSNFEDGVVSSAFMVGLLVASPIFASASRK